VSPRPRYIPLPGSEKAPVADSRSLGPVARSELIQVTVLLRPGDTSSQNVPAARPEDVVAVEAFAGARGLHVAEASLSKRTVKLTGTAADLGRAFQVELTQKRTPGGEVYRGRSGVVSVPETVAQAVEGVFGLDDRPQAVPHFRLAQPPTGRRTSVGFLPTEVAALYRFPEHVDGTGQTVAILELGGGYRREDLERYFAELGRPVPAIEAVGVDGARNTPTGDPAGPDGEVMLDVEIVGAVAPGARIAVYFAPNTSQGFLNAVLEAVHDERRRPAALSISWGAPEVGWTKQSLRALDDAFRTAGLLGTTVCAASGDSGSSDGVTDGKAHVDFPASSPFVLACGGTRLERGAGGKRSERAWGGPDSNGATGGGVSDVFPRPEWQADAHVPGSPNRAGFEGRGVPDVAANADPATGYRIRADGEEGLIGGTSAVAPLLAALVALIGQRASTRIGFVNPLLYGRRLGLLQDVTGGSNGLYTAAPGWDACTGLGSPNGDALADALGATRRGSRTR